MKKSNESIEQHSITFLQTYNPDNHIPVPIEEIIEIQLKINIIPIKGLMSEEHIDAFFPHGFKSIYIDEDDYMCQTNRSRFTLAHEVGHLILHKSISY